MNHNSLEDVFALAFTCPTDIKNKSKVKETDNGYLYQLEVPGCSSDDVSVKLKNNTITIKASSSTELFSSSYSDTISITEKIDYTKIDAKVKNGILTINLPYSKDFNKIRDIL